MEYDRHGQQIEKEHSISDFSDPEVITEFHIRRDLCHYGAYLTPLDDETRDAPDLVIVLGDAMIVVEAKFFVKFNKSNLQDQLQSQKRQVQYLVEERSSISSWLHVALVPTRIPSLDCHAMITWGDVAELSRSLLGEGHYVTIRLENAVARYDRANRKTGPRYFEENLSLTKALELCAERGDDVWIGHSASKANLHVRAAGHTEAKRWKWRCAGSAGLHPHWIPGRQFLELIGSLDSSTALSQSHASPAPNYRRYRHLRRTGRD